MLLHQVYYIRLLRSQDLCEEIKDLAICRFTKGSVCYKSHIFRRNFYTQVNIAHNYDFVGADILTVVRYSCHYFNTCFLKTIIKLFVMSIQKM